MYRELICRFHGSTTHKFGFCLLCLRAQHDEDAEDYIHRNDPVPAVPKKPPEQEARLRAERMRERIIELLLRNHSGTKTILVIPKGGVPYLVGR